LPDQFINLGQTKIEKLLETLRFDSNRVLHLRGPESPLEIQKILPKIHINLHHLHHGMGRKPRISRDSLNNILLDDQPEVNAIRLLVSHDVSVIKNRESAGDHLSLKKTCLLPKQKDLLTICCMLFAPIIELR
jgi:hypothetical protein